MEHRPIVWKPMNFTRKHLDIPLQVLRWLAVLLCLGFALFSVWGGAMEGRVGMVLALLTGALSVRWGLMAFPLMAPLFLLDASKTYMLLMLECLLVGIFLGMLVRGGKRNDADLEPIGDRAGMWPAWIASMVVMVLAAGWVGWLHYFFMEFPDGFPENRFRHLLTWMFYGAATEPAWSFRVTWDLLTGLAVAVVAARHATPLLAARWMKLAAIALVVIAILSLLSMMGVMSFSQLRGEIADPLHQGRLQGPAGHGGWLAQLFVFAWPGLALFWTPGKRRRNILVGLVMVVLLICLVLTGARGPLVAMVVAGAVVGAIPWGGRGWNPKALLAIPVGFAAMLVAGLFLEGSIGNRLMTLFRFQDRANYYVSSWHFLHEAPFGVGLGMHSRAYEARFTEFWPWYQNDHVTAHSTWLQTLVEGGIFLPVLILAGVAGVAMLVFRALPRLDGPTRRVVVALSASILGLLVVSLVQHIFYIRVIEIVLWISLGLLAGICLRYQPVADERPPSDSPPGIMGGPRLLLASGFAAILTLTMTAFVFDPGRIPRTPTGNIQDGFSLWTPRVWKTAVPRDTKEIRFSLHRQKTPVHVRLSGPGGLNETLTIKPDEWRYFSHTIENSGISHPFIPIRWLVIEAFPGWIPAHLNPQSTDTRELGVYVHELQLVREPSPESP